VYFLGISPPAWNAVVLTVKFTALLPSAASGELKIRNMAGEIASDMGNNRAR
jgi:hypothetical protein